LKKRLNLHNADTDSAPDFSKDLVVAAGGDGLSMTFIIFKLAG
jgi:hypothetical protein